MTRYTVIAALLSATNGAYATEGPAKFSCSGNMIEPTSRTSPQDNVQLVLTSAKKVLIDLGQGVEDASVLSDNKIQLKFRTKQFTGEFFHYTNDLFLIFPSGRLARLTCSLS
jgi:hypothetical protein